MKRYNSIFLIIISLLLITAACKSSRGVIEKDKQSSSEEHQRYSDVVATYKDWKTLTTSGRVSISMGSSFSSGMQLRMVKNKSISVSLRPLLGIEMARIFLTSDSIYIVDKFNKMYLAEKVTTLTQGFPLEINTMQNLIINRAFLIEKGEITNKMQREVEVNDLANQESWEMIPRNQISDFIYSFIFNKGNELISFNVNNKMADNRLSLLYSDFNDSEVGKIASSINFQTVLKNKELNLSVSLDASKIRLNNVFDDNIEINPSYRRISAAAIPLILNNL